MSILKILPQGIGFMFFFGIVYSWNSNQIFEPIITTTAWIIFFLVVAADIAMNIYKAFIKKPE